MKHLPCILLEATWLPAWVSLHSCFNELQQHLNIILLQANLIVNCFTSQLYLLGMNIYLCLSVCFGRRVLLADGVNEPEDDDDGGDTASSTPRIRTASRILPRTPTEASPAYSPLIILILFLNTTRRSMF